MTDRAFFLISKALADPQRFDIYRRIVEAGDGELPCKTLTDQLHVTPATISHHVKELVNAGLIRSRKAGQCLQMTARQKTFADWKAELRKRLGE